MSEAFLTWDAAALDAAVWQGIEYLALDTTVPGFDAVITAHLARPIDGMTAEDVEVRGGVRVTDLAYEVAITDGDSFLEVRFPSRGDRSTYLICLLGGGNDPLHPFFAAADFTFYIDCEAGDCRNAPALPELISGKPPAVDEQTKDFRGYMQVLSEWIRVRNPSWADLSPASLERVLVELVAHHGDQLSYYQDRVAAEAFIDTASQRHSLRQHGVLLGYQPFDGQAASTLLSFQINNSGFIPRGLEIRMPRSTDEAPVVFSVAERTRLEPENSWELLRVAAWPGALDARVPAGSTELLLWGQGNRLAEGQRLAFVQGPASQVVTLISAEPVSAAGWVEQPTDPPHAGDSDLTRLVWDRPLAVPLRPWDVDEPLTLFANLVPAVHGENRRSFLAAAPPPGHDPRREVLIAPTRRNSAIVERPLEGGAVPQLRLLRVPEGPVLFDRDDAGQLAPAFELIIDGETWRRVETLAESRSFDPDYVATADEDGSLWLQLGDGDRGRALEVDADTGLPPAVIVEMRYRTGDPLAGNCARDTLTEVVPPRPGTTAADELAALGALEVTNVVAGSGGARPETKDALRLAIPTSLRHGELQRAVALEDYAEVAKQADPRVARAAARALGGVFNTVLVLVDPRGQGELDDDLRDTVWRYLDERRMAGREHFVAGPVYVPLEVGLMICVCPGFLPHQVRERILTALRPGSDERPGYFHPDSLTFGEEVELGELLAFVQRIAGVRSVRARRFRRLEAVDGPEVTDRIALEATEVARLDADENFPENGVLEIAVVGLDEVDESEYQIDGPLPAGGAV